MAVDFTHARIDLHAIRDTLFGRRSTGQEYITVTRAEARQLERVIERLIAAEAAVAEYVDDYDRRAAPAEGVVTATGYEVDSTDPINPIKIERTHRERAHRWAVRRGAMCLDVAGRWVLEPMPSSRDDEFYEQHRWTTPEAAIAAALGAAAADGGRP